MRPDVVGVLQLEGSEVQSVYWEPCDPGELPTLCVRFSAASVKREGVWGHVKPLTLRLMGATPTQGSDACLKDAMGAVLEGEVRHAGHVMRALPLPCQLTDVVTLSLRFRGGPAWLWKGQSLHTALGADSRFAESYAC